MKHDTFMQRALATAALAGLLTSCSTVNRIIRPGPKVIHALPDQEQLASPLSPGVEPIIDAIPFQRDSFVLSPVQQGRLEQSLAEWKTSGRHLLLAGFASESSLPDHGRLLSQRRAEAVRAVLIQSGFDASALHTTGYGSDINALSPGDVVRVYAAR